MSTKLIQSYISICLDSKIAQLFNDTITGVKYWRDNKNHKCYKCKKKGHLANQCGKICEYCKNYHPGLPICLKKMCEYIEKIYKILNKRNNQDLIMKYEKICKQEKKMQDELLEEELNKYNEIKIKRLENPSLKIERTNIINYDFEYIAEEEKLEEDDESSDEDIKRSSTTNKRNKNIFAESSDENKDDKNSTADESRLTIKNGKNMKFQYIEKKKNKNKEIALKLERLKEYKRKIQNKTGFQSQMLYKRLRKMSDTLRIITNLKIKEGNLRGRLDDLYNKIEGKKENLAKLKDRMNDINEEKNRILNTARIKAEKIKHKAYKDYDRFISKKRKDEPTWMQNIRKKFNDEEEQQYHDKINELQGGMDKDYKRGVYEMFEDGKMGNYKDDDDFNDFYGNLGI